MTGIVFELQPLFTRSRRQRRNRDEQQDGTSSNRNPTSSLQHVVFLLTRTFKFSGYDVPIVYTDTIQYSKSTDPGWVWAGRHMAFV